MTTPSNPKPRRIYLIGPASVGKTTLCNVIANHLSLPPSVHVAEVARDVIRARGWTREDIGLLEMQQAILDAHAEKERQVIERTATENFERGGIQLLCDRSAVDPIVYAVLTSSRVADADATGSGSGSGSGSSSTGTSLENARRDSLIQSPSFQAILPMYLSPLSSFYLLEPVESWLKDDGFRYVGEQLESFEIFKRVLGELGIVYRLIGKDMLDLDERIRFVLNDPDE
ncbi:hypothetical protein E1B28_005223 [Marasmius oreades]|uniref:NadR/Ttd14 AAA domain-containing protein n=1 Tax=Marasmius oreades TaxID=181124 RepID=A0A9P7V0C2_9AGAR|nr:uncharacterized protein E1B28_005223 [Marasmius oreades]KAG7097912.1 hypothetical protein E1B28_005223 [Marasmius oreades]